MKRTMMHITMALLLCCGAFAQEKREARVNISVDPIELSDALNAAIEQEGSGGQISVAPDSLNSSVIVSGGMDISELVYFLEGLERGEVPDDVPASLAPALWLYNLDLPSGGTERVELRNVDTSRLAAELREMFREAAMNGNRLHIGIRSVTGDSIEFEGDVELIDKIVDVLRRLDEADPVAEDPDDEQLKRIRTVFKQGVDMELSFSPRTVAAYKLFEALDSSPGTRASDASVAAELKGDTLVIAGRNLEVERLYDVLSLLDAGESVEWRKAQDYQPVVDLFLNARKPVSRIIKLKHGVTDKMQELVAVMTSSQMFESDTLQINMSQGLGWLRVHGTPAAVEEFEVMVNEVDVPPVNVELTFYLLVMSKEDEDRLDGYPESIESAVVKICETFGLNSLTVLDVLQLRGSEGEPMGIESALPVSRIGHELEDGVFARVQLSVGNYSPAVVDDVAMFNLDSVEIKLEMERPTLQEMPSSDINPGTKPVARRPIQYKRVSAEMQSSLDIHEGQSVVLGKSNFDNSDRALFVIVQARRAD